jgi:hypothetical protein
MRLITRLLVGLLALVTLALSAPTLASAGVNYTGGGGGVISAGGGGMTWRPERVTSDDGRCYGTEMENGNSAAWTLRAHPAAGPGYWENQEMFRRFHYVTTTGVRSQVEHCEFVLKANWGHRNLDVTNVGQVLANRDVTAKVAIAGNDIEFNTWESVQTYLEPQTKVDPSEPDPSLTSTLDAQRRLTSVIWSVDGTCMSSIPPNQQMANSDGQPFTITSSAEFTFRLASASCKKVTALAFWEFRMLRRWSDGRVENALISPDGRFAACKTPDLDPDPNVTRCETVTDVSGNSGSINPIEIRAGYANGPGGIAGPGGGGPGGGGPGGGGPGGGGPGGSITPISPEVGYGTVNGVPARFVDGWQYVPGIGWSYTAATGVYTFGAGQVTLQPMATGGANAAITREQSKRVSTEESRKKNLSNRTGSGTSDGTGNADRDRSGSRMMKIGGFTGALLLLAAIAVGAFVFFGRRHRL